MKPILVFSSGPTERLHFLSFKVCNEEIIGCDQVRRQPITSWTDYTAGCDQSVETVVNGRTADTAQGTQLGER